MAGNAGFGGVQRHFHPARHPGLRADPAGEERPEGTAPLPPPGSGEHPSSPSPPFFFFSPPQDLGITKVGHMKRILQAIKELSNPP